MQAGEKTRTGAAMAPGSGPAAFEAGGGTTADILARFDALPPVSVQAILGRWRGTGLPSGHPLDGLLERFGWYGKEFDGPEDVDPLLYEGRDGRVFALDHDLVCLCLMSDSVAVASLELGHRPIRAAADDGMKLSFAGEPTPRFRPLR